ncbi:MAG: TRAP transporter substrate-binding protein [Geminicoccaceae bacterium]|nr:TRAP transporter substrate-binding protein [Geminicoccaceae bacterium]MDW8370884.1 TRAP transporter substrate-binding protein [Geminicoccaceae bacterium]
MTSRRRLLAAASAAPLAAPAVLRADTPLRWRMVTSWPRGLPGPGMNAQRLAERIERLTGGRIRVQLHAAGELVPALQVFDAVAGGLAELGHSAALYWVGKAKAAAFFTTVPFGLSPAEHTAWIEQGGGQALWDELYAPFGLKAFMAGNSSLNMGGWFRRPVQGLADLAGLKIRAVGLSGDVFRRLGATPVVLAVPELFPALQSGAIDAVEFLGPSSDRAQGFHQVAKHYLYPGFTKPNGTAECLIARRVWDDLPEELKAAIEAACAQENQFTLHETDWRNAEALAVLVREQGVAVEPWPREIVDKAREAAEAILAEIAAAGALERRIVESYEAARRRLAPWSQVGAGAYLSVRGRVA